MKRVAYILCFIMAAAGACAQNAAALMPELRIYFEGAPEADMDYVNGRMELTDTTGQVVALPAKFKTRGATAREYRMKLSLNMKLRTADYAEEADSALLGMRSCSSWILDAMAIDRICMRNRVAFDIWNDFSRLPYDTEFGGRNGTDGRFVEMYINDQYYGIYCLTDRINRKLLNLKKAKENEDGTTLIRGVLYKCGTQDILNINNPAFSDDSVACVISWHNAWELTYPDDHAGLAAWQPLMDAFANGQTADYVKKHFYLENVADYQLLVVGLCIGDSWGNKNRFFSIRNIQKDIDDPDSTESDRRRFVITPWDLDTSLGGAYNGAKYAGRYSRWPVADAPKNSPYPYYTLTTDPEYLTLLKNRWLEVRSRVFAPASVRARLEAYRQLFESSGAWERMVSHFEQQPEKPCYVKDLQAEISSIMAWYESRFAEMDRFFGVADGIEETKAARGRMNDEAVYDLQGRQVAGVQLKPGLYIRGSKKILIQPGK